MSQKKIAAEVEDAPRKLVPLRVSHHGTVPCSGLWAIVFERPNRLTPSRSGVH